MWRKKKTVDWYLVYFYKLGEELAKLGVFTDNTMTGTVDAHRQIWVYDGGSNAR